MKITHWKNIKLYRDILSVRRDLDEVNIEREILKIKLNETQIERSLTKPKSPNVKSDDRRSKEYEKEPEEFQFLIKIPSVFSINAFNFTPATVHLNTECDCVEGKERLLLKIIRVGNGGLKSDQCQRGRYNSDRNFLKRSMIVQFWSIFMLWLTWILSGRSIEISDLLPN